jgi:3'5'-cyclic nucleotide phosphodiesterase
VKLFHATFEGKGLLEHELDKQTFGISSNPLMRFAVVLAAVIHDIDHPGKYHILSHAGWCSYFVAGVPNQQLIKEGKGCGKSIAEAHSLNLAWELFMQPKYNDLRQTIYVTQAEYEHFRSVFVSAVLATDIMDKDLASARRERWSSAFSEGFHENVIGKRDNRATIIIEHLIQASDVSHTVSCWCLCLSLCSAGKKERTKWCLTRLHFTCI